MEEGGGDFTTPHLPPGAFLFLNGALFLQGDKSQFFQFTGHFGEEGERMSLKHLFESLGKRQ